MSRVTAVAFSGIALLLSSRSSPSIARAAVASDSGENISTGESTSVPVAPLAEAQVGAWSAVMNWPIVAVHAHLLPSGDVLAWTDYTANAGAQIWRPATNTFTPKTYSALSLFCAGHAYMADGRLLVAGGIVGLVDDLGPRESTIFDPQTETWSQGGLMSAGRYYPTTTTLSDGRVLVQGGTTVCTSCIADLPEIYDPVAHAWTPMAQSARKEFQYYPHPYLLPDGRVLVAAQDDRAIATQALDLNSQTWTTIDPRILDGHSSVMYRPGKIMKAGKATADHPGLLAVATTYDLDMTQPSPSWQATAWMAFPRSYLNLTVLPDGQVLATGGSTSTDLANFATAVYEAEMWSPTTKTWTTMGPGQVPRLYHSIALLLPDARVLVAGGGRQNGRSQPDPRDQENAEIFSPPYLFKGPRPVISSAPSVLPYNATFAVATPDSARIASVSLIALGSVTHAFNENQRFVPLTFTRAGGSLSVLGPINGNTAPPGPYMLFLVDDLGVPSVAAMVRLPAPYEDTQAPTPPGNLSATATTGAISLTWSGSTDNTAVTGYSIYRSTTSGFTPTSANRIGQTSATAYTDTALSTAGTNYYRVTANDAGGNVSAPSNEAFATVVPDVTPPTVSMTSPAVGATVGAIVAVQAVASDDVGVVGVQFFVDGAPLGAEVSGPGPTYNVSWTTTTTPNGPHILSARARDGGGNTAVAPDVGVIVANAPTGGPIASYSFDEGSGTTVTDRSGNNLTGTIVGATWTTGRYGSALSFDGTSARVTVPDGAPLDFTEAMTLEAWVFPTATPNGWRSILHKDVDRYYLFASSNVQDRPATGGTFGTTNQNVFGSATLAVNAWTHLAATYDRTMIRLFVNGVQVASGAQTSAISTSNGVLTIGADFYGEYFQGLIDEVRIYNRALGQTEIQSDMNTSVAPRLIIAQPTAGTTIVGTTVTLVYSAAGDLTGVDHAHFQLDSLPEVMDRDFDGNYQFTNVSVGQHVVRGHLVRADHSKIVGTDASVNFSTAVPDAVPPTIVLTSPVDGAIVNGIVTVVAAASDDVAMAGVQFLLEGVNLGAEVTGAGPNFTYSWATTGATNGPHTLSARARDAANNTTASAIVSVTVSNAPSTGLIAAWGFNEGTGTTLTDASGNGKTGTIAGATWATGRYGQALSFDGNDSVSLGDLDVPTAFTVMTWMQTRSLYASTCGSLVMKALDYGFEMCGGQLAAKVAAGASSWTAAVSQTMTSADLNVWKHVAMTYDGTTLRFYVGGSLISSAAGAHASNNTALIFGRWTPAAEYWNGLIDEVRIYNRALTQAEIQTDLATPVGGTPPVNTPPTISALSPQTINEDAGTGALAFTVGDDETAAGSLTVSGGTSNAALVPLSNIVFGGSGANRTVTVTPTANQNGTATISVTVSDGQASASTSFLLTVTAVNDLPTIASVASQTTSAGVAVGPLAVTVGDVETAAGSLTLSGGSSNTSLVPVANIAIGGTGSARTVTVTPAAGQTGTATITMTIGDGAASASTTFLLTVTATNTPPTISALSPQTINEDAGTGALSFTVGDGETAAGSLTVSGGTSNAALVPVGNIVFGGSGANRTVTVAPAANQNGTATITVTVSDGQATASSSFLLTVTAVNDLPTIASVASQTTSAGVAVGPLAVTVGDVETAAASLTLSGGSTNAALVPVGNIAFGGSGTNRTVTVTPAPSQTGAATITITVNDGQATASTSFVLTVSAPSTGLIAAWGFNEGTGTTLTDASGNGKTGTIAGATWATGRYGQALSFDGNDSVSLGDLDVPTAFTVMTWMQTRSLYASTCGSLVMKALDYGFEMCGGQLAAKVAAGASSWTAAVSQTMTSADLNVWKHVAMTYDGTTLRFYVGGSLISSAAGAHASNNTALIFGRWTPAAEYWNGLIDEVRIYNRALTQAEIQTDLATPVGGTPPVNTPPTISALSPQTINEDAGTGALAFTVGDGETAAGSLTVSGGTSNAALVPLSNIVFGGSGANRTVTVTPTANQNGTATISVTVSDGQATASTSFLLTVTAVNDLPTIASVASQTTSAGVAVGPLAVTVGDVETAAASLTLSGGSTNAALVPVGNIAFGGSGTNRTVTVTPAPSQTGAATITITVNDGQATASTSFVLTVSAPSTGLIAAWGFNEGTGTTLTDASGNGKTGTIAGATWATGRYGQALSFDGNDSVSLGDLDVPTAFTVMTWMQTRSLYASTCGSLVMKALDYGFEMCGGQLAAKVAAGASSWTAAVSQTMTSADLNVWKHVAMTYDGTTLRFYVGGSLISSAAGAHASNNTALIFGRWTPAAEYWNGLIDEVRIYNRALTQAEIQTDLATPVGNP